MFKIFAFSLTKDNLSFYALLALVLIYIFARIYLFISNTLYARRVMHKVEHSAQKLEKATRALDATTRALDTAKPHMEKNVCPHCGEEL